MAGCAGDGRPGLHIGKSPRRKGQPGMDRRELARRGDRTRETNTTPRALAIACTILNLSPTGDDNTDRLDQPSLGQRDPVTHGMALSHIRPPAAAPPRNADRHRQCPAELPATRGNAYPVSRSQLGKLNDGAVDMPPRIAEEIRTRSAVPCRR